jgi:hypothetical protein
MGYNILSEVVAGLGDHYFLLVIRKLPQIWQILKMINYVKNLNILSCSMCDSWRGFGSEIGFIGHLQAVTTNNYNLHTLQITRAHTVFPARCAFTSNCLVTAPTMAFPLLPCPSPLWIAAPFELWITPSESESELLCNWLVPTIQLVLVPRPLRPTTITVFSTKHLRL